MHNLNEKWFTKIFNHYTPQYADKKLALASSVAAIECHYSISVSQTNSFQKLSQYYNADFMSLFNASLCRQLNAFKRVFDLNVFKLALSALCSLHKVEVHCQNQFSLEWLFVTKVTQIIWNCDQSWHICKLALLTHCSNDAFAYV